MGERFLGTSRFIIISSGISLEMRSNDFSISLLNWVPDKYVAAQFTFRDPKMVDLNGRAYVATRARVHAMAVVPGFKVGGPVSQLTTLREYAFRRRVCGPPNETKNWVPMTKYRR